MRRWLPTSLGIVLVLGLGRAPARADSAIDAWARWAMTPKVWKGQTVPVRDPEPRPTRGRPWLSSLRLPLHVHAAAGTSPEVVEQALEALEQAYDQLSQRGFPLPHPDGGLGRTHGFDLYLVPRPALPAEGKVDGGVVVSDFDAATTFAVVDASVRGAELAACVTSAFAQAALLGCDPAEAASWVRASGELLSFLITGELGCRQSLLEAPAEQGVLDHEPSSFAAGALFLALLGERHDGGSGELLRALWELTRQRSAGLVAHDRLRGSPDLWEALGKWLQTQAGSTAIEESFEELAIARYFAGRHARYRITAALPSDARPAPLLDVTLSQLPRRARSADAPLHALGSAYVRVRTPEANDQTVVHAWLRGEGGPRWSLQAIRVGEDGRELGRVKAPARRVPQSFLPITLTPDTRELLLVVTHLPDATPDADRAPPAPAAFELTIDRAR